MRPLIALALLFIPAAALPQGSIPDGTFMAGLRYFESGKGLLPFDKRVYGANFYVGTTRYMNLELHLGFPMPHPAAEFPLDCVFRQLGGGTVGRMHLEARIDAGTIGAYYPMGSGYDKPGRWAVGTYAVICQSGEKKLDVGDFNIVASEEEERPFQSAGGRVIRVRTFAGARGFTPENEGAYSSTFDASSLRGVGLSIEVSHKAIRDITGVRFSCVFWNSRGVIGETGVRDVMQPGHTTEKFSIWTGFDTPGRWPPGRYNVECRELGKQLFQTQFDVR
ncbi:MAG TPA: hypothetical protein VLD58_13830 [Gemmatimonadales bacterium]|nr:hypothetical protein [Gemmatimonadales bacterium]